LRLAAACDPSDEERRRFAYRSGLPEDRCFGRYEEMLDAGVDAVILGSPMPHHAPQAIAALARGIHVLSEIPAAVSIDQCLRLREAVRASSAAYMMAENTAYRKECQLVKAMARAGVFGDLYYAEGQYLHDVRDMVELPDGTFTWRKRWQMDRRGVTYPTHSIGPVLEWMQDRVVSLSARGTGIWTDKNYTGDDTAVILGQTSRGGLVQIRTDLHSRRPHNQKYFQLQGTKGCYEAPRGFGDDHKVYLADRHKKDKWYPLRKFEREFLPEHWRTYARAARKAGHGGGDFFTALAFGEACRGTAPDIDVYTALDWTLPGLLSEVSIEEGGVPIDVPDPRTEALDHAAEAERASGRFRGFIETT
jgi:predicted dehydrogenase